MIRSHTLTEKLALSILGREGDRGYLATPHGRR
jgi:hypothetical protein